MKERPILFKGPMIVAILRSACPTFTPIPTLRLLFLDFDGVTNSERYRQENSLPKVLTGAELFDSAAMVPLNRIVEKTDCHIVISSSWRRTYTLGFIRQLMHRAGFAYPVSICGMTGYRGEMLPQGRWNEIKKFVWVLTSEGNRVASYVVLDDFPLTDAPDTHLIRTDHRVGLTEADADRAIAAFAAQEATPSK